MFGSYAEDGALPNTIHGADISNRNTSDAPLWFGVVCEELAARVGDGLYEEPVDETGRTLRDVLRDIASGILKGASNGVRVDEDSGLVWSPSHFTWMDTNFPAGTPREGYPVEIQALWARFLGLLAQIDQPENRGAWRRLNEQVRENLRSYFWLPEAGYLADVLLAPAGAPAKGATRSDALRPNQLFAVSLGIIEGDLARRCVDAATRWLTIPGAIRSLAPKSVATPLPVTRPDGGLLNDPRHPYWGRYEGDEDTRRKPAYHNGTAWTWPFPVYCEALARAWESQPEALLAAQDSLSSAADLLHRGCLGHLPEVLDGDLPHTQRGCDAQAWGVTETLRVWRALREASAH